MDGRSRIAEFRGEGRRVRKRMDILVAGWYRDLEFLSF